MTKAGFLKPSPLVPLTPDLKLTSKENPRIKHLLHLRNRRHRDQAGEILIEGYREILRALEARFPIHTIFYTPDLFLGENEIPLLLQARKQGARLIQISVPLMERISYRDRPDGLIAVGKWKSPLLRDFVETLPHAPLVVVGERIEKPGNLGAMMRAADGAGVDLFLLCQRITDLANPNVVRASVGTLFTLKIREAESSEEVYDFLKKYRLPVFAATPYGERIYSEVDYCQGAAIVLGNEQYGLSDFWLRKSDFRIRIPLRGSADSLNVATAAAVILFEAARQRGSRAPRITPLQ